MKRISIAILCVAASFAVSAEEFEQHAAHEHGKVTINVAVEKDQLILELEAPAMNVVGFEHAPRTTDQQAAVKDARALLGSGRNLFGVPVSARCKLSNVDFTTPNWESDEEHSNYAARYTYSCVAPTLLAWFEPWVIEHLRNVSEARINISSNWGQRSEAASRGRSRISLQKRPND